MTTTQDWVVRSKSTLPSRDEGLTKAFNFSDLALPFLLPDAAGAGSCSVMLCVLPGTHLQPQALCRETSPQYCLSRGQLPRGEVLSPPVLESW